MMTSDAPNFGRQSRVGAVPRRGHHPKIAQAVEALQSEGNLPCHLRPVERDRRIVEWLRSHGYTSDLPSRTALWRHFEMAEAGERIAQNGQCEP